MSYLNEALRACIERLRGIAGDGERWIVIARPSDLDMSDTDMIELPPGVGVVLREDCPPGKVHVVTEDYYYEAFNAD